MKAISVEELSKTFSGGTVAVDEIGFSLDKGEIGVTVFLCTHQLRYAQEICTAYGLMDKGQLFATGNITELRAMVSRNRRVRVKASCLPKGMVYKEVGDHIYDVDVASEHDIPLIVKRIVEAGGDLYQVSEQQMSWEDIYFSLIDREHAETERENT